MTKKDFKSPANFFITEPEEENEKATEKKTAPKRATKQKPAAKKTKEKIDIKDAVVPDGYRLVKEVKSERMQLLVRPTLKKELKKAAKAKKVSTNDLVNQIFEEYLAKENQK